MKKLLRYYSLLILYIIFFEGCATKPATNINPSYDNTILNSGNVQRDPNYRLNSYISVKMNNTERIRIYAYSYSTTGQDIRHMIKVDTVGKGTAQYLTEYGTTNGTGSRFPGINKFYTCSSSGECEYKIKACKVDGNDFDGVQTTFTPLQSINRGPHFTGAIHYYNGTLNNPTDGVVIILMNDF